MTDADIEKELAKLRGIHGDEVGCRVKRLTVLLEEILSLRHTLHAATSCLENEKANRDSRRRNKQGRPSPNLGDYQGEGWDA